MNTPPPSRKRTATIIVLCLILVGFAVLCVFGRGELEITPRQAQAAIDKGLPFTKNGDVVGQPYEIILRNAEVGFEPDGTVRVLLEGIGKTRDYGDAQVSLRLNGVPRFENRSFFFHASPDDIILERLTLSGKAETIAKDAKTIVGNAKGAVTNLAEKLTKGTTLEGKTRDKVEALAVSAGEAFGKTLKGVGANFLDNHPVYTLKGWKTFLISLVIEKVSVRDGNLVIAFWFLHLAWYVLAGIAAIILAIAYLAAAPMRT